MDLTERGQGGESGEANSEVPMGSGSGGAGGPTTASCSKKKSVLSRLNQKLCYLHNDKLLKQFDQYWICEECGQVFKGKDTLWSHHQHHLFKYNCKLCTDPGSQELKSSAMRKHIRKSHPLIKKLSDGYIRKKDVDWDDAVIASKTSRRKFLTVEQLRNSNRDKYDQLKNLLRESLFGERAKVKTNTNDNAQIE